MLDPFALLAALAAPDGVVNLISGSNPMAAVYVTLIVMFTILVALHLALRNTESRHKADVIRALGELFRRRR